MNTDLVMDLTEVNAITEKVIGCLFQVSNSPYAASVTGLSSRSVA